MKTFPVFLLFFFAIQFTEAQDSIFARQQALRFADSLVHCYQNSNWVDYLGISHPGIVKYYGGKHQFREYITRSRALASDSLETIELVQLEHSGPEWQSVIRKNSIASIGDQKATIISYLIGQSIDDGLNWTFFDLALNPVANIVYIMPDAFESLTVPRRQVVFIAGR